MRKAVVPETRINDCCSFQAGPEPGGTFGLPRRMLRMLRVSWEWAFWFINVIRNDRGGKETFQQLVAELGSRSKIRIPAEMLILYQKSLQLLVLLG